MKSVTLPHASAPACIEARRAWSELEPAAAAERHLGSCEACRQWLEHVDGGRTEAEAEANASELELVRQRLFAVLERERGFHATLRALPTRTRRALGVLGITLALVLPLPFVDRRTLATSIAAGTLLAAGAYLVVLGVLTWSLLRPLYVSAALGRWLGALGVTIPFLLSGLPPGGTDEPLQRLGYCFFIGTAAGAGLIVLFRLLDRELHRERGSAWLAVGIAAATANLGLHFECTGRGLYHRLLCHAPVGVALALLYLAWFNRRESDARRARP